MTKDNNNNNSSIQHDAKLPVVCSACGSDCEKSGFSPQGSNDWFCSQDCYDDYFDDEDSFQCCCDCDLPDACRDFGCAIKAGIVNRRYW